METSSGPGSPPSKLSEKLNQHLNLYALAASAAGVSLLAVAQPSEAKIVYTRTHHVIGFNGTYNLDLNHDGTVDFIIREWNTSGYNGVFAKEAYGNAVQGYSNRASHPLAAALQRGARIGPGRGFVKSGYYGEAMAYVMFSGTFAGGPWVNVTNRYLGLKFQIDGKTHYGWARLSVKVSVYDITATLTGYAYETVPNQQLQAGQTGGTAEDEASSRSADREISKSAAINDRIGDAPRPASLGMLALGAPGLLPRKEANTTAAALPRRVIPTIRRRGTSGALMLGILLMMAAIGVCSTARAQTFTVLHTFKGRGDGADPSGVYRDAKGNLYGTTGRGGAFNLGTVFRLDTAGKETILHSFTGGDGLWPAGLVRDPAGNFYGTTADGGTSEKGKCHYGCGTVFEVNKAGKVTVLYAFTGATDGALPFAGVVRDDAGNLYGTTLEGGDLSCNFGHGCGVVFKVDTTGKETVLHTFTLGAGGFYPTAGLVQDEAGNLYSTASQGGDPSCNHGVGCGVVFRLDKAGKETVLYAFGGGTDGNYPIAGLVRDAEGNLYGTTVLGGELSCGGSGCGVVFKLDKAGKETVLHAFIASPTDGAFPNGVVRDPAGSLYGTTEQGGDANCGGCGTVFKVDASGTETLLYSFRGGSDSSDPAVLIRDPVGDLYGTTLLGGDPLCNCGVVFKLTP